jgi:hypothetical protein
VRQHSQIRDNPSVFNAIRLNPKVIVGIARFGPVFGTFWRISKVNPCLSGHFGTYRPESVWYSLHPHCAPEHGAELASPALIETSTRAECTATELEKL